MRIRNISIFILLLICCHDSFSQDEIDFSLGFRPAKRYHTVASNHQQVYMKFTGPKALLDTLKKNRQPLDRSVTQQTDSDCDIETSAAANVQGQFGFTMRFNKLNNDGDSMTIPPGTKLRGKFVLHSMPSIDSVESDQINENSKKQMIGLFESMFSDLKLPGKKMKKGESFIYNMPFNFPMGNSTLTMNINTNYKLLEVKKGMAIFEIKQLYEMASSQADNSLSGKGHGEGQLIYSINDGFYTKYHINAAIELKMKTDKFEAAITTKGIIEENTTITAE